MFRKLRALLRKRSEKKPTPERAKESREQMMQRLIAQKKMENFWAYDGDEQTPIDPAALLENSQ